MAEKRRLDHLLVGRRLAESGRQAQALVMAGQVSVDGRVITKPGTRISTDARVEVRDLRQYVSRGGLKLEAALNEFDVEVPQAVCADVGASTGGFTDCLLQRKAARVYAIDVGYGQLAWKLRQDQRVVVMERTNVRYLADLPEPIKIVTIDVSFISLRLVLPMVCRWLADHAEIISLIKPQFEAGRNQVGKGGVVRDPAVHRMVLEKVNNFALDCGLSARGLIRSPIVGPAGNIEFLIHLQQEAPVGGFDVLAAINRCVDGDLVTCRHSADVAWPPVAKDT